MILNFSESCLYYIVIINIKIMDFYIYLIVLFLSGILGCSICVVISLAGIDGSLSKIARSLSYFHEKEIDKDVKKWIETGKID